MQTFTKKDKNTMKNIKWLLLLILSFIWGSSFILIKKALISLSPLEIGALRIIFAGIILFFIGFKKFKHIEKKYLKPLFIVAIFGTFFPIFLFSYAITEIDSSIAAVLNSLTPLITMVLGVIFFNFEFSKKQVLGIFIGLFGTLILLYNSALENPTKNYFYAFLIFIAATGYAFSVNYLKRKFKDLDAVSITASTFTMLVPLAFIILCFSDFFDKDFSEKVNYIALGYVFILAAFGTSMAMLLFNKLIQISNPIFSASVSYLITLVAVIWGVLDGEKLTLIQGLAAVLIIWGVVIAQKKIKPV
jgi:drug/metabolite transporter (DMT)-like permease